MGLSPATLDLVSGDLCKTYVPKHSSPDCKQVSLLCLAELETDLILDIIKLPVEKNFNTLWDISMCVFYDMISIYVSP